MRLMGMKDMPREFDLEAFVRSRTHLRRGELIRELEREGDGIEAIGRSSRSKAEHTRRGEQKERQRNRAVGARRDVERIGRILFFLRNAPPVLGARPRQI
jgi:hypothetical protein